MSATDTPGSMSPAPGDIPDRSEAEQRAFFDAAMERCLAAEERTGTVRWQCDLAGTRIEFVFAGSRFVEALTGALNHLHEPVSRTPDVTIHVWDTASSGVEMIPAPVGPECFTDRGEMWGFMSPRIRSAYQHWMESSLSLLDLDRGCGMYWVGTPHPLPPWTLAAPFRTLLHWWMEAQGGQLVHGAAVGVDDTAMLISGQGGTGKSTTALACLSAGMLYIGDDYLAVTLDPEPRVHSLYSTAKLDAYAIQRFPNLYPDVRHAAERADDKSVMQLLPRFATQVRRALPLTVIATPSFGRDARTSVEAATPAELRRAAEFSTVLQLPHAGRAAHAFIQRMVDEVPGVRLMLGSDVSAVPGAIADVLRAKGTGRAVRAATDRQRGIRPPDPMVSVVIPVYNGAAFLPSAVRSVVEQEYDALDIVVVDDGSIDDVLSAVAALPVPVRLLRQLNAGPAAARNRGIRSAAGDYLAFLDVDDLWAAGTLRRAIEILEADPAIDLVKGRSQLARFTTYDDSGTFIGNPAESFPYIIGSAVYRRSAFARLGLFDERLRFGEDQDWFVRAHEAGLVIRALDEVTLYVRRHGGNMTHGKSAAELNPARIIKNAIDRRRAAQAAVPGLPKGGQ